MMTALTILMKLTAQLESQELPASLMSLSVEQLTSASLLLISVTERLTAKIGLMRLAAHHHP